MNGGNRQTPTTHDRGGSVAPVKNVTQSVTYRAGTSRLILPARAKLIAGLRVLPAVMMLLGVAALTPSASATSCGQSASIAVNGGAVTNATDVRISADGGVAISDASGGDNNVAVAGSGGLFGDGGSAAAGNGGIAVSDAGGGMIDLDDINSGNNSGNTIAVSGNASCGYSGNVAISGGSVANETDARLSADGGAAVAIANGGNGNVAVAGSGGLFGDGGNAAAGNGGVAVADASSGSVTIGDINSGGNSGNTIVIGG